MISSFRLLTITLTVTVIVFGLSTASSEDPRPEFLNDSPALPPSPDAATGDGGLSRRVELLESELNALRGRLSAGTPVGPANGDDVRPANAEMVPRSPIYSSGYSYLAPPATPAAPAPPKYPNVTINGFFQADTLWFGQDAENRANVGDIQDGADFRRTRLSAKGAVADNVNYFVQMDFGFFGRPTFTDIWGEVTKVPVLGNVRVGQWKQPFGLETVTSVRYQPFLERSLLFQTFMPFRHIGAGFYDVNEEQTATWAMSVFKTGNDQFGGDIQDNGGFSSAGRLTYLPYFEDHNDKTLDYMHLGMAYWFGTPDNQKFRYSTIPEAYVGAFGVPAGSVPGTSKVNVPSIANGTPPFADTGTFDVNTFFHLGSEFLWVRGPFSIQSESILANVEQTGRRPLLFWGSYLEGSYFLTGESRTYDRKAGALDRITPISPFTREGDCGYGPGAWEALFRVSHVDLSASNIRGGYMTDLTAGLNWYLNGYTKFQLNYIRSMLDKAPAGPSRADIAGIRFQVDF